MSMSRKDFHAVADVIRKQDLDPAARKALAYDMASTLCASSPRFDPRMFVVACGLPAEWAHEQMLRAHNEILSERIYLLNCALPG